MMEKFHNSLLTEMLPTLFLGLVTGAVILIFVLTGYMWWMGFKILSNVSSISKQDIIEVVHGQTCEKEINK